MKQFLIILVVTFYLINIFDYFAVKFNFRADNKTSFCTSYMMKTNLITKFLLFGIGNACLDEGFYPLKEQTGEAKNE